MTASQAIGAPPITRTCPRPPEATDATAFPDTLGLTTALLALDAALVAYPKPSRHVGRARARREPARTRRLVKRAAALGAFYAPAILIVTVPNLVLLDLRLSLPVVGFSPAR